MGKQGNDPHCPCGMIALRLQPSNQWTEKDKQRLDEALKLIFEKKK